MGSPVETLVKSEDEIVSSMEPLVVADRCDRCQAQAFVQVASPSSGLLLLFCGHHFAKHESTFASGGWTVDDQRHLINAAPSKSSGVAADDE